MLRGPWKLVRIGPSLLVEPDTRGALALYAIVDDPTESNDVSAEHPDVVEALLARTRELRALQPPGVGLSPPPGWTVPPLWRIPES